MNAHDPERLMHVVLDGESSDVEARELDRLMAADPALRERFDDLKRFFAQMRRVPDLEPPEELEHTILNEFNVQLRASTNHPVHSLNEGITMSQRINNDQDPTVTNQPPLSSGHKKRVIVGATLAAVALLVAGSYVFDIPKDGASGTIVPAQRYRADQPTSGDIKLGSQPGKQNPSQAGGSTGAGQSGAGQSGAGQSGAGQSGAGGDTAQGGAGGDSAQSGAGQSGAGQSGAGQSGAGQSGAGQSGAGQSGAGQSGAGQSGAGQSGAGGDTAQGGAGQSGAGQSGAGQSGAGQSGAGQSGSGQSGSGQSGAGQSGAGQSGASQGVVQSGSGKN